MAFACVLLLVYLGCGNRVDSVFHSRIMEGRLLGPDQPA